ncbi:MAG: PhoH family protein [Gammaproteobacteria bacterium]|nr:PhoH family protein [Gammaproteobacteria bacterium]
MSEQLLELTMEPADNKRLARLCGEFDKHLKLIEQHFAVEVSARGNHFNVAGKSKNAENAAKVLTQLYRQTAEEDLDSEHVHMALREAGMTPVEESSTINQVVRTRRKTIRGRGRNQLDYLHNMRTSDLTIGIGPAGTGKTYLAVARAVEALEQEEVRRIILVRPAVEAGERLGFLPGDLSQKIDPYLRPMYDALYEMLGFERVARLVEKHVIEVAPLAFMRGRSLSESFVILDEAQNTSVEQMKMFLTRIGFGSRAVVTGDVTQTDLPRGQESGLNQVIRVLAKVKGVSFTRFNAQDVVRHPLVQAIVEAYAKHDKKD